MKCSSTQPQCMGRVNYGPRGCTCTETESPYTTKERSLYVKVTQNPMDKDADQLRVQLAGCLAVAQGATDSGNIAKQGEYGWSPAYQAVLELRLRLNLLLAPNSSTDRKCATCGGWCK